MTEYVDITDQAAVTSDGSTAKHRHVKNDDGSISAAVYVDGDAVVSGALQSAAAAPGNGTVLAVDGKGTAIITVSGTYTGLSLIIEGTEDGTTWSTLNVTQLGTNVIANSIIANGVYQVSLGGCLQSIRARVAAIATGSVTVTAHAAAQSFTARVVDAHLPETLAGEDLINNVLKTEDRVSYANINTSTLVKTGAGRLFGFVVNSHTNGTLKLWDNTSAATTVMFNTITFAAGPNFIKLPGAVEFEAGLFAEIGGTADITILYR